MTIKRTIIASWILLAAIMTVLLLALYSVDKSAQDMDAARQQRRESRELAEELKQSSVNLTSFVRLFAVTGEESFATLYNSVVAVRNGQEQRPRDRNIAPGKSVALTTLMEQAGFTGEELALLRDASDLSNGLIRLETEAMNAVRGLFPDASGNFTVKGVPDIAKATVLVHSAAYRDSVNKIMQPISRFEAMLDKRLDSTVAAKQQIYDRSLLILTIVMILLMCAASSFLLMVQTIIVKPILKCDVFARHVAEGNLDSEMPYESGNEIGSLARSLRRMVSNLRERTAHAEALTREAKTQTEVAARATEEARAAKDAAEKAKSEGMRQAGERIRGIVEQARQSSSELSRHIRNAEDSAKVQQQRLTETSQAMSQLSQTVMEVAHNTAQTTDSADAARQNALKGAEIVTNVVRSITAVDEKTVSLGTSLNHLGEQAEGIGRVMSVISDIADQTNLLALNAAIEAARAGDAGRGFAVVADEVRKLAEKTMQATGEVGTAVRAIQTGTAENIRGMQDASSAVGQSTTMARSAGDSLTQIVDIAKATAEKIHSIAVASELQSSACGQISRTTDLISELATKTSQSMQGAGQSVQNLNSEVEQILAITEELRRA